MANQLKILERLPYTILVPGFALTIGLMIPVVYEFSRPGPVYGRELWLFWVSCFCFLATFVSAAVWLYRA